MNSGTKMSSNNTMVVLKTTAQIERYASGIFDNEEKTLYNEEK